MRNACFTITFFKKGLSLPNVTWDFLMTLKCLAEKKSHFLCLVSCTQVAIISISLYFSDRAVPPEEHSFISIYNSTNKCWSFANS